MDSLNVNDRFVDLDVDVIDEASVCSTGFAANNELIERRYCEESFLEFDESTVGWCSDRSRFSIPISFALGFRIDMHRLNDV